jgi:hypothetical protein
MRRSEQAYIDGFMILGFATIAGLLPTLLYYSYITPHADAAHRRRRHKVRAARRRDCGEESSCDPIKRIVNAKDPVNAKR